jgi:hypothetical protein
MVVFRTKPIESTHALGATAVRVCAYQDANRLDYQDVLRRWQHDDSFVRSFTEVFRELEFTALRFETPPIGPQNPSRAFEMVLSPHNGLTSQPDKESFAEYFCSDTATDIVNFPNLSGDTELVVPKPLTRDAAYAHLGTFMRDAPNTQQMALWRRIGELMQQISSQRTIWLNTDGSGISWLHVRLDTRPKYYRYSPYMQM